jgi:hypothetical protein
MVNRLAATLYFLTTFATLSVGLAHFTSMHAIISPIHVRWLASTAIVDFAVPTIFLLAGISASWINDESKTPRWVTAATTLIGLMLIFFHYGLGWRPFSAAAGPLLSVVFILGSSVRQASTIAGIGAVGYAVLQGPDLVLNLQSYWEFGETFQQLVATTAPPILVTASLVVAIYSHFRIRAKISRVESQS